MFKIPKWVIESVNLIIFSPCRTQGPSLADGEDSEDFPLEFTLHLDPLTQDVVPCTSANAVEVHRDMQSGRGTHL